MNGLKLTLFSALAFAAASSLGYGGSYVKGYTRKDGTVVSSYFRGGGSSSYTPSYHSSSSTAVSGSVESAGTVTGASTSSYNYYLRNPNADPDWIPGHMTQAGYVTGHYRSTTTPAVKTSFVPTPSASIAGTPVRTTPREVAGYKRLQRGSKSWTRSASESAAYGTIYLVDPSSTTHSARHLTASSAGTVERDSHGRIKRSAAAKAEFMRGTGYPHGRPGYVVDHIIPLKKGGADDASNMQWQTIAEAKAKDKWE